MAQVFPFLRDFPIYQNLQFLPKKEMYVKV